jgi:dTDP-4-dehydrorhamnose reductase
MKILILGASGLIGNTMYRVLSSDKSLQAFGTIREDSLRLRFANEFQVNLISGVDLLNYDALIHLLLKLNPDVIINCAGVTKHLPNSSDPLMALPINALMPHRVAALCRLTGARFIHVSTDCVFLGSRGNYRESDLPDARDVYGQSKALGEVVVGNSLTIRTSTLGHELSSAHGLLNWFLNQKDVCRGYRNAVFSGLPTVVLAQVIRDFVLTNDSLRGLMHLSAQSINKFNLLQLIAKTYGKVIDIQPDDGFEIDRSLDGSLFSKATGFIAPEWPELIQIMFDNR